MEELSLQPDHLESTVLLFSLSLLPLIFESKVCSWVMYLQTVLIRLNIVVNGSFSADKFENLCGVLETSAELDSGTPHIAGGLLIKSGNP